ncbi:helix-turn-helix domain-containing protein [Alkalihalobacillus sp. CinArs1]|uniref:helix-turn-helix domain-containing protein n=1 Tax=Alkalihalobacillus sp. CinArs1 TaxID=2995314 RepID=UPI0022DD8E8B|nr:helix-turn-helix domain-containing protein [Alkalihalobacillus sp. CinArs1]
MSKGLLNNEAELSKRQLHLLMEVSTILNSSLNFYSVIQSVIEEAVSAIDAAEGGILFLLDENEEGLKVAASTGFNKTSLNEVVLYPGESMTGLSFERKKTMHFPTSEKAAEAMSTMTSRNKELYHESAIRLPMSTVCVPIKKESSCTGVIVLDNFNEMKQFEEEDIKLVEAISSQAAIAIENAGLYENKKASIEKLKTFNKTVVEQNENLSKSVETHQSLSDFGMEENSFQNICTFLANSIDRPVVLFSAFGDVQATSIEEFPHVEEIREAIHCNIRSTERSIGKSMFHGDGFMLFALGRLTFPTGYLAILSNGTQLTRFEHSAIWHSCTVAGLQLMKKEGDEKEKHRLTNELLINMMSVEGEDADVDYLATRLHTSEDGLYTISLIDLPKETGPDKEEWLRQCVHAAIQYSISQSQCKNIHVTEWGRQIVLLFYFDKEIERHDAIEKVDTFVKKLTSLLNTVIDDPQYRIGIGKTVKGMQQLFETFKEAKKTVLFLRRFAFEGSVASYADIGALRLLLNNNEKELSDYTLDYLSPLLTYEKRRKGDLFHTLFIYLSTGQDLRRASELLHIHVNTMNYRIQRIQEILSVDFNSPGDLLNIQVACNIYKYLYDVNQS